MSSSLSADAGRAAAREAYTVKTAFGLQALSKGLKWGGKAFGFLPTGIGNAIGAGLGGLGGVLEGVHRGEGVTGALSRGALGAASGALPLGAGIATQVGGDYLLNRALTPGKAQVNRMLNPQPLSPYRGR